MVQLLSQKPEAPYQTVLPQSCDHSSAQKRVFMASSMTRYAYLMKHCSLRLDTESGPFQFSSVELTPQVLQSSESEGISDIRREHWSRIGGSCIT